MSGAPAVIATNGYGMAVRPVDSGAPVLTVADNGFGMPIVISDLGAPFVVEGLWSPEDMFTGTTQGTYFDPSDRTTLFQDAAGTTPANQPGDPVGRMLDKSGRNNHATQSVAASRPTLARHPKGGRRNQLAQNVDFSSVPWVKDLTTISGNRLVATATTGSHILYSTFPCILGQTYTFQAKLKYDTHRYVSLRIFAGGAPHVIFDLVSGTISLTTPGATGMIVPLGGGEYHCSVTYTGTSTGTGSGAVFLLSSGTDVSGWTATGTEAVLVRDLQLELGAVPTPYQKVTSAYDVTEAGVEDLWYLAFDGVDDGMVTPAIDLTGTDKVGVFAGVRKLSDAAIGIIMEHGTSTSDLTQSWHLSNINGSPGLYQFIARGTGTGASAPRIAAAAPDTAVIGGIADIAAPLRDVRRNGVVTSATANMGTGNFGNHQLYVGRRAGTSLPFNGNLYGLIVAGKMPTAAEITNTEAYLNGKTGAY